MQPIKYQVCHIAPPSEQYEAGRCACACGDERTHARASERARNLRPRPIQPCPFMYPSCPSLHRFLPLCTTPDKRNGHRLLSHCLLPQTFAFSKKQGVTHINLLPCIHEESPSPSLYGPAASGVADELRRNPPPFPIPSGAKAASDTKEVVRAGNHFKTTRCLS